MDRNPAIGGVDLLSRPGVFVELPPPDLHGGVSGRALIDFSNERRGGLLKLQAGGNGPFLYARPLRIVGLGEDAHLRLKFVRLVVDLKVFQEPQTLPERQDEQPGRQRVKRAGVSDSPLLTVPPDRIDDVVGCLSPRLVDQ